MAGLSGPVPRETIEQLETAGLRAWPAARSEERDGWLLRFNDGFTKRANSANALRPAVHRVDATIDAVEAAYRAHGLRPTFRLTPLAPPDIDARLARRGYAELDRSLVQTLRLAEDRPASDPGVIIEPRCDAAWLRGYTAASALAPRAASTLAAMLSRIPAPTGFARLASAGEEGAFGFAAVDGALVGLFDIVTASAVRRRGLGGRLVAALLGWAATQGARRAYLQVVEANAPARRLYEGLGFTTAYAYHYRIAPS